MKTILGISLALVMLCGSVPLGFSESINQQLQQGLEIDQLQCSNDSHVLVQRTNGNPACVSERTSEKMGWEKITITKNIDDVLEEFENTVQLSLSDVFIKSNVEKISVDIVKSNSDQLIREPMPIVFGYNFVIIAPFDNDGVVGIKGVDEVEPKLMDLQMLKSTYGLEKELDNPQTFANRIGEQTSNYTNFFPDYVPDGMELKFIAGWDGGFNLIYAPISVSLDPLQTSHNDVFDQGGIIFHYVISDEEITSDSLGDKFLEGGKRLGIERSIETVGSQNALVFMQEDRYGGYVILHKQIGIHTISSSFGHEELYKMLENPIEEPLT